MVLLLMAISINSEETFILSNKKSVTVSHSMNKKETVESGWERTYTCKIRYFVQVAITN